jgi:hypothetical protein
MNFSFLGKISPCLLSEQDLLKSSYLQTKLRLKQGSRFSFASDCIFFTRLDFISFRFFVDGGGLCSRAEWIIDCRAVIEIKVVGGFND